ncbi:RNA-directed DNA polymerase from mobile element jockey [Merluccius polli]|uniref:RNA-directed DNA polymerase from mobile element jockey n=1 Tax=Merluccius polli TaxID=89951 RepID=A0AA47PCW5_MERPO|nr:RNA-directed DNA polymerase from mobile element jockey [Merluccius polli]
MEKRRIAALLVLWLLVVPCIGLQQDAGCSTPQRLQVYSREWLLSLRQKATPEPGLLDEVPEELLRTGRRRLRKRGRRGGIQHRLRRRRHKPPLPYILLMNKMDELRINTKVCHEYRESSLMIFTETWLQGDVPDQLMQVQDFKNVLTRGKTRGGGISVYINDSWCSNYTIKDSVCTPDLELLCLSLRPFYLPRDYGNIFISVVYIPPSGNAAIAASRIADCVHKQLQCKPDAPMFILGDFNHCKMECALPGFQQYVTAATRKCNILDKCYGNITDAYASKIGPPLSNSDHNTIRLIPTFKPALKRSKPLIKSVSVWREGNQEELSGCFLATDWSIFYEDSNIDNIAEAITGYIQFCVDTVVAKKTVKKYPNNKDYITPEIKQCIQRKKQAFRTNNTMELKAIQKDLKGKIREAREQHSLRVRDALLNKNSKQLWDAVKYMTNLSSVKGENCIRFDCDANGVLEECNSVLSTISCDQSNRIVINSETVARVFGGLHTKKATGPDGISALLLKTFARELAPAWSPLFQLSVDSHSIPKVWKRAIIIPVPKKSCPKNNNDFRPVALTSIVMKAFERIMVGYLKQEVQHLLDPYQFAYQNNRGTDDALNITTHLILKHLENSKAYARLLFMDFSSAFNTILPQTLLKTLDQMEVNPFLIRWYFAFLTGRQQQVKVNSTLSHIQEINTGAPQGCVSSPILFTLYTNNCKSQYSNNYIIKFSDDTVLLSLLLAQSDTGEYRTEVQDKVLWCEDHNLILNVDKTKEMIFDPKGVGDHSPVFIKGEMVQQVSNFKYLGIYFDCQLQWATHVETVCSKICQRLHFLRRLRVHGVDEGVVLLFYRATIESVIRYGITTWFGNLTVKGRTQLQTLVKRAGKIMGTQSPCSLQEIFEETVRRQGLKISADTTHVLNNEYELLPSGRRYRMPACRLNRYKFSFVPMSIKLINNKLSRNR